ncbi:MAG: sulfotransferase domain-containing protein [Nitrospirae bacterium]|nr:sulfotransferase domain-containing protein [Nitrospirota bacterium]
MQVSESVIVVTGLPRSGTSMMMRMLHAGGLEVVTDNIRKADEDNPDGYYEFEKVKQMSEDASWLDGAKGKAVKMASMLLYDLPMGNHYKLIFMKRKMEEILASQRKMLARKGVDDGFDDGEMRRLFSKHLAEIESWIAGQKNMEVLYLDYNDMLMNPLENIRRLNAFLDEVLDAEKMAGVVDPSLYRNRISRDDATGSDGGAEPSASVEDDEKIKARLSELGYM